MTDVDYSGDIISVWNCTSRCFMRVPSVNPRFRNEEVECDNTNIHFDS